MTQLQLFFVTFLSFVSLAHAQNNDNHSGAGTSGGLVSVGRTYECVDQVLGSIRNKEDPYREIASRLVSQCQFKPSEAKRILQQLQQGAQLSAP